MNPHDIEIPASITIAAKNVPLATFAKTLQFPRVIIRLNLSSEDPDSPRRRSNALKAPFITSLKLVISSGLYGILEVKTLHDPEKTSVTISIFPKIQRWISSSHFHQHNSASPAAFIAASNM